MSNSALVLGCTKFDVRSFKAKNRAFEFDYQNMNSFKSVRCSNQFNVR